jgi:hypothetical protein
VTRGSHLTRFPPSPLDFFNSLLVRCIDTPFRLYLPLPRILALQHSQSELTSIMVVANISPSSSGSSSSSSSLLDIDLELDDADLQAIVAVQIADLEEALALQNRKGKAKEGASITPAAQALQQYRDYLSNVTTILADARLAASINQALNADAGVLGQALEEEQQALRDREMAISLSEEEGETESIAAPRPQYDSATLPLPDFETHTPGANPRLPMGYATGSGVVRDGSTTCLVREIDCCSCMEFRYCVAAPCGDAYCHRCLIQVFKNACTDEELFPPRCCREEIPLFLAAPFLRAEEITLFKEKNIEVRTLAIPDLLDSH